jgi:hypothetical protein
MIGEDMCGVPIFLENGKTLIWLPLGVALK